MSDVRRCWLGSSCCPPKMFPAPAMLFELIAHVFAPFSETHKICDEGLCAYCLQAVATRQHRLSANVLGVLPKATVDWVFCVVELVGIEPTTSPLRTARSPKLSYSPTWPNVASVPATREFPKNPSSFFRVEIMVDEIVTELEIEIASVLLGVLHIRVVDHDVRAPRCWIKIKMAAKAVLPPGFSYQA
jgi:hypothetical protein